MDKKIVLVTGATAGIGEACARLFAKNGYAVIVNGRREVETRALAEKLTSEWKTPALPLVVDVRDPGAVKTACESLPLEWKRVDILINNAGLALGLEKLHEGNLSDWDIMIDTNVKGLLYLTRFIVPGMVERNSGHVINIGSIAGLAAYPNGAVYCATKAAVHILSDGLRIDLVDKNIRVTNIQPGMAETNFSITRFHGDTERAANVYKGIEPMTGDDVADAVLWAATRPTRVQICEITMTPLHQSSATVVYKKQI